MAWGFPWTVPVIAWQESQDAQSQATASQWARTPGDVQAAQPGTIDLKRGGSGSGGTGVAMTATVAR